ncbi:MAG: low temperature requirement protein A [Acidobacteria bacterium]|nr:MAG: low temperature requirement protein A [Acidobacteriota bacterium]PYV70208.1 MAG: low temperature requirement protein A [Acidobacteriota bacterium]
MSTHPIRLFRSVRLWPADQGKVRRASWLELFFDLIFVAAVSQVGVPLGEDYSIHGLIRYSLMFLLIWWAWFGHTMYSTRFDADDVVHRLLTLVQIFAAAAMAANAKQGLADRDSAGFGAAYAVQRVVLVIQYLRARREQRTRRLTTIYATGFGIAAVLWAAAAVVPPSVRFWLWGAALLIDLSTPMISSHYTHKVPPHPEHLPERFGLFTIILLGESVAAVMRGMESQETWPVSAAVSAFSGLALVFGVWWWYFDVAYGAAERHVRSAHDTLLFHIWSHAHFLLYLSIAVLGVGIEHVISLSAGTRATPQHAWILIGAASVLMSTLCVIGMTSCRPESHLRLWPQFVVLAFLIPAPLLTRYTPSCILVMQVLLACAAGIFLERLREGDLGSANGGSRHHLGLGNPAVPADYA